MPTAAARGSTVEALRVLHLHPAGPAPHLSAIREGGVMAALHATR
jgi:hypothetical protein